MSGYSTFYSLEAVEAKRRERIYNISKRVYNFFSDDAPTKYGFEYRDGQIDMTCEIIDALMNRQHMVVEAGVGIGKSFAYLAPLLLYHAEFRSSVVVATSTIALQEQLSDDIEHLKKYLDTRVSVCLCKGQTHYICKTRAHERLSRNRSELTRKISADIQNGAYDRRAFSYEIPQELWDEINVKKYNKHFCAKCVHRDQCGYHNLRGKMLANSSFILCNQDLLTAHLKKISIDSDGLLPSDTEIIVVDEVHNLESKVRSATTARISQHQILNIATVAANDVRGDGKYDVQDGLRSLKRDLKKLFAELSHQLNVQITKNPNESKYSERFFFENTSTNRDMIYQVTRDVKSLLDDIVLYASIGTWHKNHSAATDELADISRTLEELIQSYSDQLIWLEKHGGNLELVFCPKNTKAIISKLYFGSSMKTIMTSATLTNVASGTVRDQYSYFLKSTGFPPDGAISEPKPSPFPYDKHALVYYCNDLPHPRHEHEKFIELGVKRLVRLLRISGGKALVLFTAKMDMEEVYHKLCEMDLPYRIIKQEPGASQEKTLHEFKTDINSVLLGTGAYWEGISIEGKSLSHLIIFRLPFPTPDPIIDHKSKTSSNPLMEILVPEMVIKLKQGVGRLIRNFTDKGLVSIIDSRLKDDNPSDYHDLTWESIPIKNKTDNIEIAERFYKELYPE